MRLHSNSDAPPLVTRDFMGSPVDLAALRGRPVLLCFFRYASCPVCNLHTRALIQAYPQLSRAGLHIIAVFQSPPESIRQYVGRQEAPFPIVADPAQQFYRRFGVESRWRGMFSLRVIRSALAAIRLGFKPGQIDGPFNRTPADFLINGDGTIGVAHYGRDIDDHLPLAEITRWLERTQHAGT